MGINSYNIFGITGGIGHSFFNLIKDNESINICGFYHEDHERATEIKVLREATTLHSVDLSSQESIKLMTIPDHEGILYVAGKPHFSNDLFAFTEDELMNQLNINIYAILAIIKKTISYPQSNLKKIIIVTSVIPKEINNIYHLFKKFQIILGETLCHYLNSKNIGFCMIESSWVDTKMFKKYLKNNNRKKINALNPKEIAQTCFDEFQNENYKQKIVSLIN